MDGDRSQVSEPASDVGSAKVAPARGDGALTPAIAQILALQRSAGNRATGRALRAQQLMRMQMNRNLIFDRANRTRVDAIVPGTGDIDTTRLTPAQRRELLAVLQADRNFTVGRRGEEKREELEREVERDRAVAHPAVPPTARVEPAAPRPAVSEPSRRTEPIVEPPRRGGPVVSVADPSRRTEPVVEPRRVEPAAPRPAVTETPRVEPVVAEPTRRAVPVVSVAEPTRRAVPVVSVAEPTRRAVPVVSVAEPTRRGGPVVSVVEPRRRVEPVVEPPRVEPAAPRPAVTEPPRVEPAAEPPRVPAANPTLLAADEGERPVLPVNVSYREDDGEASFTNTEPQIVTLVGESINRWLTTVPSGTRFWSVTGTNPRRINALDEVVGLRRIWFYLLRAGTVYETDTESRTAPNDLPVQVLALETTPGDEPGTGTVVFTVPGAGGVRWRAPEAAVPQIQMRVFRRRDGTEELMAPDEQIPNVLTPFDVFELPNKPGTRYRVQSGTIRRVSPSWQVAEGDLFPVPSPRAEDVEQTGLGDCYLQALLIELALRDPNHLRAMMQPRGNVVTVRFYRQLTATEPWTERPITVTTELPRSATGSPLYNAGATWARLIQKAFAVFAEENGQYGFAYRPRDPARPGYRGIESGFAYELYRVFYGPRVVSSIRTAIGFTLGAADRGATLDVINRLIAFADRPDDNQSFLTASADIAGHVRRAIAEANVRNLGDPADQRQLEAFRGELATASTALTSAAAGAEARLPSVLAVKRRAETMLGVLSGYASMQGLRELCLDLKEIGRDTSQEERFVYSKHAYAIVGVDIRVPGGRAPRGGVTREQLASVDFTRSTVTLRNPHHSNVPTEFEPTTTPGLFTLTLDQFLRHFTNLDEGVVRPR